MPNDRDSWLNEAQSRAAAGDHLLAYDVASRGLEQYPQDPALKHAAVLALARSGAPAKAGERYLELGLGNVSRADVSATLYTDIKSLDARIAKDLALAAGSEHRQHFLAVAAHRYREIFDETGDYYPGVNAATTQQRQRRLRLRSAVFASGASPMASSAATTSGRH